MSAATVRLCSHPGCSTLTTTGRCAKHPRHLAYDNARGTASERGYDYRWQRYAQQFKREHPLCKHCMQQGIVTASACVDHIEPVTGPDDPRFWDPTNHQALCVPCHSSKTVTQDGGFGRERRGG